MDARLYRVISVAAPTDRDFFFVLDGSTSAVAGGKLEIARRRDTDIPEGWALDENGQPTTDPHSFLRGGGLLPMGGSPSHGAYKGFGMALYFFRPWADACCSRFAARVYLLAW